jgi:predicted ATP-grasp superfamily ATP-dependent carboligase
MRVCQTNVNSGAMKILVFEYISGGGFNRNELPTPLAREGLLMLKALLDGLCGITELDVTVMLDARLVHELEPSHHQIALIGPQDDCFSRFRQLAELHDAVWPIAPEFDAILFTLCRTVEQLGKTLLMPSSEAVKLAADKYETFQCLIHRQIPTVTTRLLDECPSFPGESIVKPVDGAGCNDSYLIRDVRDFDRVIERLRGAGKYIIQPHLYGEKTSLSCLFKNGRAWLLAVNLQQFEIVNNQYQLSAIRVNHRFDLSAYQGLICAVAEAVPGLWGYAGIDLIETSAQTLVLEINPRLTTSFAGLNAALGINPVALVLQLLHGEPVIRRTADKPVTVEIKQKTDDR